MQKISLFDNFLVLPIFMDLKAETGSRFYGKVRDISSDGLGVIDHPSTGVFFSLGVFPEDEGEFELIKLKEKYGIAKLIELKKASPLRIAPPCPHQGLGLGKCGGCPWMTIPYETQIDFKTRILRHLLLRHNLISKDYPIRFFSSPHQFGFRNRAQFKTDGKIIGFVSRFSRTIAPIEQCLVLNEKLQKKLRYLLKQLPNEQWTPGPGYPWSYLEVDDDQDLTFAPINTRRPFRQGNSEQNQTMRNWLKEQTASWPKNAKVLELFCGSGNFTEVLLNQNLENLFCVDIANDGLAEFKSKNWVNARLIEANLFKPSDWKLIKEQLPSCDYLILDPPRSGFEKLDMLVSQFKFPREIVYISCDLNSFNNEAGRLKKRGYKIKNISGLDQFPHTPHLEILAVFKRDV
jgi:23S rRNA (uracil1939-C5)-methyltransferase